VACDCRATARLPSGSHIVGANFPWYSPDSPTAVAYAGGPAHTVTLTHEPWLAVYEISAGCYARCVREGACTVEAAIDCEACSETNVPAGYWRHADSAELPIAFLTYQGTEAYCRWLGGRLPTNAEWEKAARNADGRRWPWADAPDDQRTVDEEEALAISAAWASGDIPAHFPAVTGGSRVVVPVDEGGEDVGPFGHRALAGNVAEWVAGWLDEYGTDPVTDPGPASGPWEEYPRARAVRGGVAWLWDRTPRTGEPGEGDPYPWGPDTDLPLGGRCAFDEAPEPLPMWETMSTR